MSSLILDPENAEKNNPQAGREGRKRLLVCLFFSLLFIGVASAAIYNLMHVQSEVGVNVAFVYNMLLLGLAHA